MCVGVLRWLPAVDAVGRAALGTPRVSLGAAAHLSAREQKQLILDAWQDARGSQSSQIGRQVVKRIHGTLNACGGVGTVAPDVAAAAMEGIVRSRFASSALTLAEAVARAGGEPPREEALWHIVKGLGENNDLENIKRAVALLDQAGYIGDHAAAYNRLIAVYGKAGATKEANAWEARMHARGVSPNKGTYEAKLTRRGHRNAVVALQNLARLKAWPTEGILCKALCSVRQGSRADVRNAVALFEALPRVGIRRTPRMYEALLSVCASVQDVDQALLLYGELMQIVPHPSERSCLYLITACTHHATHPHDRHEAIAAAAAERAFSAGTITKRLCTHMMRLYAKTGNAGDAERLMRLYLAHVGDEQNMTVVFRRAYDDAVRGRGDGGDKASSA